jgi:uncharacterized repeat protein (TIGR01451 family)
MKEANRVRSLHTVKSSVFLKSLAAVSIAASAAAVSGQTNAIQLFGPVNVRPSTQGTGYGSAENVFNTTILNLSCTEQPIQAKISSSSDGTGKVLVDNFITFNTAGGNPWDICREGTVEHGNQQNCFNSTYGSQASNGGLNGQDPDLYVTTGGVPAIDISGHLSAGAVQAQIGIVDTGGYLTSSTLYLVTNCTSNGVAGPGQVTGNPISQSNPTDQQLTQGFSFNSTPNQQVQFAYDLSQAQNAGSLSIPDGSVPSTGDTPLNPATFQSTYLHGTSFATANCLLHTGELYNNAPACKLFTLTCQIGTNPNQAGTLCPKSLQRNEIFQEVFDGPSFTLPDIAVPNGPTFHQGVGFLEAQDSWNGGSCVFDPASSLADDLCPQNILTNFSGPGGYKSGGNGQSPNSSFITVAPVPEDLTTVSVTGQQPGYWVNSHTATVNFVSTPPTVASQNNFVAAPIANLTYGISNASSVPTPGSPIPGDITVTNSVPCPLPKATTPEATVFTPPAQSISVPEDGQYLIHYLAQDCAGTEELKFTQTGGNWSTSFYTAPLNVDTVAPVVFSGPTLSPAPSTNGGVANSYLVGQTVTATYRCKDDRSGVVKCGTSTYAPGATLDTGNITSPVDTSTAGTATFTVNAVDAAGNQSTASVKYLVVAPPVNLAILKLVAPKVQHGSQLTYVLTVGNLGKQPASAVVISDPLPAGVAFVKASAQQLVCSNGKCSNPASCTFAGNTVSCTTPSMTLLSPVAVEIVVQVQATAGTKIKNTATVSSANPEGSPGNTQSTATTVVY